MPSPNQPRAAIYVRVSTTTQDHDGTSLASQEEHCRTFAAEQHFRVGEEHIYREVHTGAELWERPKLTQLRETIRRRGIDTLVVYAVDRLSRKQAHVAILADECERAGVSLLFVTEEFERSPVGEFMRNAKAFAAEVEREKIRERTQRGLHERIKGGKPLPGSRPLYGYRWRDKAKSGLLIDEGTSPIVRRIFAEVLIGRSLRSVATGLTADGIPTPTGQETWKQSTIHNIVQHPGYTGKAEALRYATEKVPGQGKRVSKRDATARIALPDDVIPALVSPECFATVQAKLASNKGSSSGKLRDPESFLLRGGYLRCAYCGKAVSSAWRHQRNGGTGSIPFYQLSNAPDSHRGCHTVSINAATIDAAVWQRVESILTEPEIIAAEIGRLRAEDTTEQDLDSVDRALHEATRRQGNLARSLALLDDEDAAQPVAAEMRLLAERKRQLQAERAAILARREGWQEALGQLAGLERWCRTVATNLRELTYEQRRTALDALNIRVRLFQQDHEPRYEITAALPLGGGLNDRAPTTQVRSVSGTPKGHRHPASNSAAIVLRLAAPPYRTRGTPDPKVCRPLAATRFDLSVSPCGSAVPSPGGCFVDVRTVAPRCRIVNTPEQGILRISENTSDALAVTTARR